MKEIRKKCWPEFFELVASGKKNAELRLADFGLKAGDILVLEEWDPETRSYTGRKIRKRVKSVFRADVSRMHSSEEIMKNGFYIIEMV
jgi:ASC-1-like (ASCH) protein